MLIQRPESEVCVKHPGLDEDLVVTTDTDTLTEVHRGRVAFPAALASGRCPGPGPRLPALGRSQFFCDRPAGGLRSNLGLARRGRLGRRLKPEGRAHRGLHKCVG